MIGGTNAETMTADTVAALAGKQGTLAPTYTSLDSKAGYIRYGSVVQFTAYNISLAQGTTNLYTNQLPRAKWFVCSPIATSALVMGGYAQIDSGGKTLQLFTTQAYANCYIGFTYITDE